MFCEKCGTALRDDARFCRNCGAPVAKSENLSGEITCSICRSKIESGRAFCQSCGAPVEASIAPRYSGYCSACHAPLESGKTFCTACGAPVVQNQQAKSGMNSSSRTLVLVIIGVILLVNILGFFFGRFYWL